MYGPSKEYETSYLKSVVIEILGGVGAISPELYKIALQEIADRVSRPLSDIKPAILDILRDLPCPLD